MVNSDFYNLVSEKTHGFNRWDDNPCRVGHTQTNEEEAKLAEEIFGIVLRKYVEENRKD